ncbi:MAG TPA: DUF3568 family protein [Methylomirabilota bacterium]
MLISPAVWLALIILTALMLEGCAMVGLTLLGVGAGVGTNYTLDGIAYRTFTVPIDDLRRATLRALKHMDVTLQSDDITDTGRAIVGLAGDRRTIDVELERLTSRTTRIRVTARYALVLRDRATAAEFIAETERALDDAPALSRKAR